ncbi:MAG: hypothetical protein ACTSU4_10525 [Promethearchaeota archaeon]
MAEVKLEINEKSIPLNNLMQEMLKNLILAYLKSAKKIPEPMETIKIDIIL